MINELAVREFGGDLRYVAEYLSHEVLAALIPEEHAFLLEAAVLGRFTAELCDSVLGRQDSAARLDDLENSNMFVVRLERQDWFRVHPLFAQFATARLVAVDPGAAVQIHRRAAAWFRSRGLVIEAVEHASAAGDHAVVAELLSEYHLALLRKGRAATLLRWTQTLPDETLTIYPELAAASATAATVVGQHTLERRRLLELARRAKAKRPERFSRHADATMAMVHATAGDVGVSEAVREGRRAVELAEDGADDVFVAACAGLARALYFAGGLDEAWRAASRAVAHPDAPRRPPGYALAQSILAVVAVEGDGSPPAEPMPSSRARSSAESPAAAAGSARTRPWRSGPCWPPRATSLAPSANSHTRSASSRTRSRPSTTPGCSSGSPMFAVGVDASMKRT